EGASIEGASIEETSKCSQRTQMTSTIQQLPEEELSLASNLISTMRYPKELLYKNHKLVKRTQSLEAKAQHLQSQKSRHITEIHSLVRFFKEITNEEFHEKVKTIFNPNKKFYSSNTTWLTTTILQVGEMSLRSTVEYISELQFNEQIHQIKNAQAFEIMVNESTIKKFDTLLLILG
ncbi:4611_t:CDS:2, partial [Cetraspora pellucida]